MTFRIGPRLWSLVHQRRAASGHMPLLYAIDGGLNSSVVVFPPGDLESQAVVCGVLCREFGYTVHSASPRSACQWVR
jgi:hypothetical protein